MKKILFISSTLIISIAADNSLGTPIVGHTIDKVIKKQTITKERIEKELANKTYVKSYTKSVVQNRDKSTFKSDHHRYDKRYQNFDYEHDGYYNDDGYYYGYYDDSGYFYNNIFFTYNSLYTYEDRRYRRGYFIPRRHHYRRYRYHRSNDWNRVHCYREPNHIVYGHYYEDRHYPNNHRDHAQLNIRRNYNINQNRSRSSINNYHTRRYNQNYNTRYNDSRSYTQHRTNIGLQGSRTTVQRYREERSHNHNTAHMQMSR